MITQDGDGYGLCPVTHTQPRGPGFQRYPGHSWSSPMGYVCSHPRITLEYRAINDIQALHNPVQWVISGRSDITLESRVIDDVPAYHHTFIFNPMTNQNRSPVLGHYRSWYTALSRRSFRKWVTISPEPTPQAKIRRWDDVFHVGLSLSRLSRCRVYSFVDHTQIKYFVIKSNYAKYKRTESSRRRFDKLPSTPSNYSLIMISKHISKYLYTEIYTQKSVDVCYTPQCCRTNHISLPD